MAPRNPWLRRALPCLLGLAGAAQAVPSAGHDLAAIARDVLGRHQGVYVETSAGDVLVAQAAELAVHPASVSKVPTTLALLRRLGPEYRFDTTFSATGPVSDGVLHGDLLVGGGSDPYFVDENALLVAARLNGSGLLRVSGTLRAAGALTFDWLDTGAAPRLLRVLSGAAPAAAWSAVQAAYPALAPGDQPAPSLTFAGTLRASGAPGDEARAQLLLVHHSQPLVPLVKMLNDYSNNIFKPLADAAGGASAVQAVARDALPAAMAGEVTLGDGAGTDPRNRMSPRAVVRLLRALEQELARSGRTLTDILPVSGIDEGTLHERLNGPGEAGHVVGKTGTFGDYGASALVGALRTADRGTVYFAILDHGVPVPAARRRQDAFVRALLAALPTLPWPYQRDARPAVARASITLGGAAGVP